MTNITMAPVAVISEALHFFKIMIFILILIVYQIRIVINVIT